MISTRWHKVLKDLWGNKVRTLLAVMAIAAGVFAVGVISSTYFTIDHDVNLTYAAIHPAHGVLTTELFDEEMVKVARRLTSVEEAEGRVILGGMNILLAGGKKQPLSVTAVDDLSELRLDQLKLMSGAWPDRLEMVVVSNDYAQEGKLVQVELPDGRVREMRISGIVEDMNTGGYGRISADLNAYMGLETLDGLDLPRDFNRLYYRVSGARPTQPDAEAAGKDIERLLARNGLAVIQSNIRVPNQHSWYSSIKGLLGILALMSMLLLALGGLLVTNTISSLLAQQVRQIGIMKAVGALFGQVLGMYLVLASGFGVMASVLAAPVAPRVGYALAQLLAGLTHFALLDFRLFPETLLLMLMVGLLTPCLASLVPVVRALRITVHEAIASHGLSAQFGNSAIDRLAERIRGLSRPLLMSMRNTFRRKGRLLLTLSTLSLAGAIFMSVFAARASFLHSCEPTLRLFIADVGLDFKYAYRTEKIIQMIEQTPGVVHAEGWAIAVGEVLDADGVTVADRFTIYAPPLNSPMTDHPPLAEGRWLREGDRNALVISSKIARKNPAMQTGNIVRLRIDGHSVPFLIIGQYDDILTESDPTAFAMYSTVSTLLGEPGRARSYRVMIGSSEAGLQEQMGAAITDAIRQPDDSPLFASGASVRDSITFAGDALTALLMMVALLIVAVGGIGLASTMSMNILERTREIGVMRAIGARNAAIREMVIAEGVSVGALSWLIALGLSFPLSRALCYIVGIAMMNRPWDYVFDWTGVVIWLGLVVGIAALASLWPAHNAARMTVRDALAYE